ncbi:hypothetical protein [Ottowia thiooxydans]|uniref:hypothetical protein n=1 Tax=Ottowia thiooxydans TaxID=219182 RepID=UPI0012ECA6B0|nr:hypothetical protein [Ottowia thiooxydans]
MPFASRTCIARPSAGASRLLPTRLAMLPSALACTLLLASCGGGSDETEPTYASRYPALAAHAAMDEEDFDRFLKTAGRGTDITQETIKSLSVGASIDSGASTYNLRPIFDLGRLKDDNLLNVDTTRSQQKTELRLTSNKNASSASSQATIDGSASGSYAGFKAAAAYHQANAWKNTHSDGSISVQMVSANTNNIVSILSSGFSGSENLTPYLIGTQLTDEQLRGYVSVTESASADVCGGKSHITGLTISRYKMADAEPYANMQLLSRMESIFADLRAQHELCSDAAIKAKSILQMTELRGKIESAIADFYAFNGDSFVSQTTSMNQGVGKGQLTFSSADGNTEAQYGASLSAEYQTAAFGAGATGAFQYYKQNGWASALQNVQVSAESWPAGVADTTAWVSSLYTMLKDQGSSVVPPLGGLPKDPGVKLPTPVGPKKEKQEGPPDSVFSSYDDWKKYQADKKSAKDAEELERARQRAESLPIIVDGDWKSLQASQGSGGNAYLQLIAELDDLKQRARVPQQAPQAGASAAAVDGNLVRFDKMYVSGFETTPYDSVIPQLRPNLEIPGMDKAIGSFPQLMDMMLAVEKFGKLDSYLRFLANLSVSNVTPEMSARYHQFFQTASSRAYDLVALAIGQGADITPEVLAGYKQAMFGGTSATKAQSELYKSLQDMDYYDYVVGTLLDPVKGKTWATAPGGYLPMRWKSDGSGGAELVTWTALSQERGGHRGKEGVVAADFSNPNADPLALYSSSMKALQTPWYPVYIFNQGNAPALVFVQNFGAYQAIYGARWVVRPFDGDVPVKPSLKPLWSDYQALGSNAMRAVMTGSENSFLEHMSWDYSVYFPLSGNDPMRLRKFNALLLTMPADFTGGETLYSASHSAAVRDFRKGAYDVTLMSDATYNAFRLPVKEHKMRRMSDGAVVDTALQKIDENYATSLMLLPLNTTTTGASLKQAFNYAPERAPMDIVTPTSLDLVNKLAVLLQ